MIRYDGYVGAGRLALSDLVRENIAVFSKQLKHMSESEARYNGVDTVVDFYIAPGVERFGLHYSKPLKEHMRLLCS